MRAGWQACLLTHTQVCGTRADIRMSSPKRSTLVISFKIAGGFRELQPHASRPLDKHVPQGHGVMFFEKTKLNPINI